MTKITPETLMGIGFIFDKEEYEFFKIVNRTRFSYYSPCRRFVVTRCEEGNNISYCPEEAWSLHIDNSDMESIGCCDVEFIEQIIALMEIYKDY